MFLIHGFWSLFHWLHRRIFLCLYFSTADLRAKSIGISVMQKRFLFLCIHQHPSGRKRTFWYEENVEIMQIFETHNVRKKEGKVLLHSQLHIYSIYWCWFTWACYIFFTIKYKTYFGYRVYTATTDKIPASTWIYIFSFIIFCFPRSYMTGDVHLIS